MDTQINLVTLKTFYSPEKAYLLKARLESEGIPASITGENISRIYPVATGAGGVKLQIQKKDSKRALKVIESIKRQEKAVDTGPCPKCGSKTTVLEERTSRGILGVILMIFSVLLMIPGIYRKGYYVCQNCGHERKAE